MHDSFGGFMIALDSMALMKRSTLLCIEEAETVDGRPSHSLSFCD